MPSPKTKTSPKSAAPLKAPTADTAIALVEANRAAPSPSADAGDVFLTAPLVRHRYGGISDMSLHRWTNDPKIGFPQPMVINDRRYWRLSELQTFERSRVGRRQTVEA